MKNIEVSAEKELLLRNKRSVVLTIATRTGIKKQDSWEEFNTWMKNKSVLKKDNYKIVIVTDYKSATSSFCHRMRHREIVLNLYFRSN